MAQITKYRAHVEITEDALKIALWEAKGSVSRVAFALSVTRPTIYAYLAKYEIDPNAYRPERSWEK